MKIIYMGTPEFALPALEALIDSSHDVVLVVTQPDRIKGRGKKMLPPPVKELALENGIPVMQPETIKGNEEFINTIKEINPDAIVVAAYGRILPKEVLDIPKYGCLNIHASLLPRWRGAAPMQHAILEGDEVSGVTIMQMAEGLDTGDMLLKEEMSIEGLYHPTLSHHLSQMGGKLILEALEKLEKGEIEPEVQDDSLSTYAGMINKAQGHIDFSSQSAREIERMIRAFEPWPGAYCSYGDVQIKFKAGIAKSLETEKEKNASPGEVLQADDSGIYVKAKDSVFVLKELQIPGKNWMDSGSYLRGHKLEVGTIFQ